MNKQMFNTLIIIAVALFLIALGFFDVLEASAKFMLIPMLALYFIGQYSERKFPNK